MTRFKIKKEYADTKIYVYMEKRDELCKFINPELYKYLVKVYPDIFECDCENCEFCFTCDCHKPKVKIKKEEQD